MTAFFLIVILGATDKRAPQGFAPIAIGLCLTLIHLISIPVTNTSVNPARSTGVALFAGGRALSQLWLFWIAPIIGAVLGATCTSSSAGRRVVRPGKRCPPDAGSGGHVLAANRPDSPAPRTRRCAPAACAS